MLSVALFIQYAARMCHTILSSVACLAVPHFSTLPHKRHDFRGQKLIEHKNMFRFFYNSETFLILRRINWGIVTNVHTSSCKVPVFPVII